jgi:uncharacterized protein (DUF2147 family)
MKRLCCLVALMAMSSSAHADSFSFVLGGYRIRIEASRHCGSLSCAYFSIPGIYQTGHSSSKARQETSRQEAATPALANAAPLSAPASPKAPVAPVQPAVPASTTTGPAASSAADALPEPAPKQETRSAQSVVPSVEEAALEPVSVAKQLPAPPAPDPLKSAEQTQRQPDTPLGDWRTESSKGAVRIERCGQGLCGYVLDPATDTIGITVLINMRPSTDTSWSGSIFSRSSGTTYNATMTMSGPNILRVEACAIWHYFCSSNSWTRMPVEHDKLITSREATAKPRS